jgi:hypothetical protein
MAIKPETESRFRCGCSRGSTVFVSVSYEGVSMADDGTGGLEI